MARVLVVEDNQPMREMYKTLLEAMGHAVLLARDGVEGLHGLKSAPPDLVLLDLSMPVASGDVVLGFIRSTPELAATRVVIISALPEAETLARQLEADACLMKPVELDDLRATVNRLLS